MKTDLIESLARPGLLGIVGQTLERKFTAQLKQYFQALGRRIGGLELEKIAASETTVELARHAVEMKLQNPLRTLSPLLKGVLELNIADGMLRAQSIHHFAEADDDEGTDPNAPGADSTVSYTTGEEASLYASVRTGELVTGINQTTQIRIADMIAQGIEERLGVDGTASLLRQVLSDMVASRARTIASTEMNDAFSEATMRKLDRMEVEYKQWITAGACCDDCAENEDASPIPIDDEFPSGDDRPPAHPNCRCAVSGARAPVEVNA